jgi:3-oxoadipate enol-lactonase
MFDNAGQDLHYLVRGSGEPVLLIHGMGSSGADWAFQVPALESRFRVDLPDLPDCGLSTPPPQGNFSIAYFATSLWALIDEIGVSPAIALIIGRSGSKPRFHRL